MSSSTSPEAKIAPSVLASDFGKLAAECTRIIKDGADWLHMGEIEIDTQVRWNHI